MSQNLKLNAGTLANQCWTTPQAFANDFAAVSSALLNDITGIIISDDAPGANDRDKAWYKTTSGAPTPPVGPFIFYNGQWIAPHPTPASGLERRLWVGNDSTDLDDYDGGSAGAVGPASGPMWEVDTAFAGRFPIAPGTIPGTSPARTVAVQGTADSSSDTGEYVHTIARAELPAENLKLFANEIKGETVVDITADSAVVRYSNPDSEAQSYRMAAATATIPTVGKTDNLGSGESFINAPPFYGVYIIKRTARIYLVG